MKVSFDLYKTFYQELVKEVKLKEFIKGEIPTTLEGLWKHKVIAENGTKNELINERFGANDPLYFYKFDKQARNGPYISINNQVFIRALEYIGIEPDNLDEYNKKTDWEVKAELLFKVFKRKLPNDEVSLELATTSIEANTEESLFQMAVDLVQTFFDYTNKREFLKAWSLFSPSFNCTRSLYWIEFDLFKEYFSSNVEEITVKDIHLFKAYIKDGSIFSYVFFEEYTTYTPIPDLHEILYFLDTVKDQAKARDVANKLVNGEITVLDIDFSDLEIDEKQFRKEFLGKTTDPVARVYEFEIKNFEGVYLIHGVFDAGVNQKLPKLFVRDIW